MTVRQLVNSILDATEDLDEKVEIRGEDEVYHEVERVGRIHEDEEYDPVVSIETGEEVTSE